MPAKIRLQRYGRRKYAYYHIVVADSRAPRDGKFIERIGSYNPNTSPATIEIDVNKSVQWMQNGAQPTDTVRAILSYKGALMKLHLQKGVAKGALTQEQADAKFEKWLEEKNSKITTHVEKVSGSKSNKEKARLAAEAKVNEERQRKIEAKKVPFIEGAENTSEEAAGEETSTEETSSEETSSEETSNEETPATETNEDSSTEEAPKAE